MVGVQMQVYFNKMWHASAMRRGEQKSALGYGDDRDMISRK